MNAPRPADYGTQESQHDVFAIEEEDAPIRGRTFESSNPTRKRLEVPPPPSRPAKPSRPKPEPVLAPQPRNNTDAHGEPYLRARRVAEMKFNTIKLLVGFGLASAAWVAIDLVLYPGLYWSQWPVGMTAFIMLFPITKCFVFRGKDLRSVIEARLHKMALREVERYEVELPD